MDSSDAAQCAVLIVLLCLSAFFSSAETALTCVNKIRIRSLAEEGNKRALTVQKLTDNPSRMLSTILIGNNIVNLSASSLATMLATKLALRWGNGMSTATFVGIATGILTVLILIFGEITPKSAAAQNADSMALSYAPLINLLIKILTPVIVIINALSGAVMRLMGTDPDAKTQTMTETELLTVIDVSHEEGILETEEKEMITNVVDFGDSVASDVMVPRYDVEFVDITSNYEEVCELFRKDKYSRLPVYDEDKDHIVGILNFKDFFCYTGRTEDFNIRKMMRKPYFTYEFHKISDVMVELQKNSYSMAIVLDEYGSVAGLLTIEDLLEEIVGEIRDEYDEEETDDIRKIATGEYWVDGSTRLEDINELLGTDLESSDYESIAGHIMKVLEHIPSEGESIPLGEYKLTVHKMDKRRIETIHITKLKPAVTEETKNTEKGESEK